MLFHWQRWAQDQAFLVGIILPCGPSASAQHHLDLMEGHLGFSLSPAGLCGTATGHFPSKFEVLCWALLVAQHRKSAVQPRGKPQCFKVLSYVAPTHCGML